MKTFNNLSPYQEPKPVENLRQLAQSNADVYGDKDFYVYKQNGENVTVSYNDFNKTVRAFGTGLYKMGLAGKTIAISGDTHPNWTAAFIAIISAGGVAVPLDRDLDAKEAAGFLKIADCSAVIYTASLNKKFKGIAEELPLEYYIPISPEEDDTISFDKIAEIGQNALDEGEDFFDTIEPDMEKMSILLFTSGTTGTSKGVMLSHGNIICCINASCNATQYCKDDRFVSVLPIHHTYELAAGQLALSNQGASMFICEGLRYATRNFKEYKPTALVLVPLFLETVHKRIWDEIKRKGIEKKVRAGMAFSDSMLRMGVDLRPKLFSEVTAAFGGELRSIVCGGAPVDPQILRDFYSFGITVHQGYGITECSPLVAVNRPGNIKFDSVGQPVDNCEVKIVPLEDGEGKGNEGEILVRGGNVMLGYYKNEEATRAAFTSDGWYRTGDVGKMNKQGHITITGRLKNIIIASNGKNVFPEELEEHLMKIDAVKECVVVGREESGNVTITAVIVPNLDVLGESSSDTAISFVLKEAIAQINRTLPPYKHINKFEIRHEDFERTLSKKIKRFLVK
ncbi:MAG: AMP-binding protein [Clostridia bacterium]|nr:AMP-binding protein [Clostridia bacterium]